MATVIGSKPKLFRELELNGLNPRIETKYWQCQKTRQEIAIWNKKYYEMNRIRTANGFRKKMT